MPVAPVISDMELPIHLDQGLLHILDVGGSNIPPAALVGADTLQ
jgi:hypothetical protein